MVLIFDTDILPKVRFIGSVSYKTPWVHFHRKIDEYVLYIIKSGELYIKEADVKYILKKGDVLLLQSNIPHEGYKSSCCDYYFVHFKHPGIEEADNTLSDMLAKEILQNRNLSLTSDSLSESDNLSSICYIPKYYHIKNESILFHIFHILDESIADYIKKYECYKKIISCNLLRLFITISREYTSTEVENSKIHYSKTYIKVKNLIDYINTHYSEKLTSQDIESTFKSNYDYLNRIFHSMTGYTILHYINNVRIIKAKELIESSSMNFSEIGYLVGIESPYYFSKLFKKYTGSTPTQYLKRVMLEVPGRT